MKLSVGEEERDDWLLRSPSDWLKISAFIYVINKSNNPKTNLKQNETFKGSYFFRKFRQILKFLEYPGK